MSKAYTNQLDSWVELNCSQQRIGVFDSGIGGLTVLKELNHRLPNESFLYFGDTARVPYGTRTRDEIITYARQTLTWMVQEGVKMAVMACNTSSALALDTVRSEFNIPILGIILPGARAAVQQGRRIGVMATPATVASNSYQRAILEIQPQVEVWQIGCPEFVPLIENNQVYAPETAEVVQRYLQPLLQEEIDTLVYGCTHYPHLAPVISALLPRSVRQVNPAVYLTQAVSQELQLLGLGSTQVRQPTRFCVSGCPVQFAQSLQWLGFRPEVEQVVLPVITSASPLDSSNQLTL